jgi:hypothetical protein
MGAPGGKGARMQGKVALIAGDVLRIAVGGQGGAGSSVAPATWGGFSSGGGGGGSSIFKVVGNQLVPLMIAGGGGGSTFRVQDNWYLPADSAEIAFNNFSLGGAGQASSDNNGQGGSIDFRNNVKLAGFATLLKDDAVPAGSGGGLFSSGASWSGFSRTDSSYRPASGGQSYFQGNYGGSGNLGADGGWGGGGEGNTFGYFTQDPIFVTKYGIAAAGDPWGYNPGYYLWGNGGGGGGYSGGSSAGNYLKLDNSHYLSRGGAGGYSYSIASCRNDSSGAQMGNGLIRIAGPIVLVDTVSVVSPTYTWPVNGVTYRHSGTYNYLDQSNCAYRVLNLTIGGLGGCLNYKRIDTTIVSCGTYTSPLNGRTYTENMIDSFEVGCNRYVVKLITSAPATFQEQALPLEVCKDKTISYSIPEVPFATSYQWTLPSGISGSSKTNKIVLKIRDNFKGGTICVSPVNSCGVGKAICRQINVLKDEPKGSLIISGPPAPYISGNYSVTPIKGATTYTWKLSNSQARIVSGQGTAQIQLEAGPDFRGTELSVRASNCEGKGSKAEIVLGTVKEEDDDDDDNEDKKEDDDDDDDEKDTKKFVNIKGTEAIDLANSKGMGIGATPISISAYPNPTSGKLTVQFPASVQQGKLEVYNKDGQLVQTLKVPARSQSIPIDLSTKAKGLYLIRYYAGQEMKSIKVVVK